MVLPHKRTKRPAATDYETGTTDTSEAVKKPARYHGGKLAGMTSNQRKRLKKQRLRERDGGNTSKAKA